MLTTRPLPVVSDGDCRLDEFSIALYRNPTAYPAPTQDGRYSLLYGWENPTPVDRGEDGEWILDPPEISLFQWPPEDTQAGYEVQGGRWVHTIRLQTFVGPTAESEITTAHDASLFANILYSVSHYAGQEYQIVLDCSGVTVNPFWWDYIQPYLEENWPDLFARLEIRHLDLPLDADIP